MFNARFVIALLLLAVAPSINQGSAEDYSVGTPELVSRPNTPNVTANSESDQASPSPNAEIVAFRSSSTNLVAGDDNEAADIFVRYKSRSGYVTERISIGSNGEEANGSSEEPSISQSESIDAATKQGTYGVAFVSNATNLSTATPTNTIKQVFLRVPKIGKTFLVSGCFSPTQTSIISGDDDSTHPSVVSVNGGQKFIVAFTSKASNLSTCGLGTQPTSQQSRIYIATIDLDLLSNSDKKKYFTIGQVAEGVPGDFFEPALSGDGKSVVFVTNSTSSALGYVNSTVPGSGNGRFQVVQAQKVGTSGEKFTLISGSSSTQGANGDSDHPSVGFSSSIVAFRTFAPDLPGINTSGRYYALVVRSLTESNFSASFQYANTDSSGTPSNAIETSPQGSLASIRLHPNGRAAALVDRGTNLDGDPNNALYKVFFKDLGTNKVVKRVDGTQSDADSLGGAIGSLGFNSTTYLASFATNSYQLSSSLNIPSELTAVYLSRVVPSSQSPAQPPTFKDGDSLTVQPDVTVGPRRMYIVMQKFQGFSPLSVTGGVLTSATRIVYDVRVHRSGTKRGLRLTTTRNTLTLRDLTPGKYTVRYRVKAVANGKTKATSGYSPTVTVVVKNK